VDTPSWDDPGKALPLVLEAVKGLQQSLRTDPNDQNVKHGLAVSNSKIAYYLRETDPPRAAAALEYTIGLFESMARQEPANVEFPIRLARYRARMALVRSYMKQKAAVETLVATVLDAARSLKGQSRLQMLNTCALSLANVGSTSRAAPLFEEATRMANQLSTTYGRQMTTMIEVTRAFEQHSEFCRQSGDNTGALRFMERSHRVWRDWKPITTYVRLRQARGERLLARLQ
jgi:hypothetical protein